MFVLVHTVDPLDIYCQVEDSTEQALAAHLDRASARMQDLLQSEAPRRYVIQVTCARFRSADPRCRKLLATWMQREKETIRAVQIGTCFVTDSILARGALTAVLWLARLPTPHSVAACLPDAITHATKACRRSGLTVSPDLEAEGAALVASELQRLHNVPPEDDVGLCGEARGKGRF